MTDTPNTPPSTGRVVLVVTSDGRTLPAVVTNVRDDGTVDVSALETTHYGLPLMPDADHVDDFRTNSDAARTAAGELVDVLPPAAYWPPRVTIPAPTTKPENAGAKVAPAAPAPRKRTAAKRTTAAARKASARR